MLPVQREQLAVTMEGIGTEVDELKATEAGQRGQGPKLVLLQMQALELWPQAREGSGGDLQGDARPWRERLPGLGHHLESPRWSRWQGNCWAQKSDGVSCPSEPKAHPLNRPLGAFNST